MEPPVGPGRLIRKLQAVTDERRPAAPFIVGASRSGTTLLRLMLDAHPLMAIPPETHFIQRLTRKQARWRRPAEQFVASLCEGDEWDSFGLDRHELDRRVREIDPFDLGAALRAFYTLYAERFDKPRWGDKTPGYLNHMTAIQDLLPEARFVHLIRDGRDVALSVAGLPFGPSSLEEASGWWVERVTNARAQVPELNAYLEVRYEDLVRSPEPTLRDVAAFLDLPWDDAMLDYHRHANDRLASGSGRSGTAIHARTSSPPDQQRVGRWRREMDAQAVSAFEQVAGTLLEDLGYPVGTTAGHV